MFDLKLSGKAFIGKIVECEIGINGGRIARVGKRIGKADAELAFKHELIFPGFIDAHVHFREPGYGHKEDIATGSLSAAHGGIACVLDMPNTNPPTTTVERVREKTLLAKEKSVIDFRVCAGVCDENVGNIAALAKTTQAFGEIFMSESFGKLAISDRGLLAAYGEIAKTGKVAITHAEDAGIIGKMGEKYKGKPAHHLIRPNESEAVAVKKAISFAGKTRIHFAHISARESVELVRNAKGKIDITFDVTPHHLFLTYGKEREIGNFAKVNPPLRSKKDCDALWRALAGGIVDCVISDHAPHTREEKEQGYWKAPSGMPGVETTIPLLFTAVSEKKLGIGRLVGLMCKNPARRFSLKGKGEIKNGNDADFSVVDLKREWKIGADELHSKCGWTPFEGFKAKGKVVATISRGKLVFIEN